MTDRRYYLDEWLDEVVPCDCTLEAWAEWLSKPDADWDRDAAANDGDTFPASVIRFEDDAIATKGPDGWVFDREPAYDLLAVRFGQGLGWSPDNICDDWDAVRELLSEGGDEDGPEYIAIGINEPDVIVTYRMVDGKPTCTIDTQQ